MSHFNFFRTLSQSSKSFEIGRNPLNYQNFLFNIANVDCLVERSGNERGLPRLEPKLRDKMLLASTVDPRAAVTKQHSVFRASASSFWIRKWTGR